MKYFEDENGIWAKKTLDSQIICFKPEIEAALAKHGLVHKIELSNSTLRYILTVFDPKYMNCSVEDKGYYLKTLRMGLQESIEVVKNILPDIPIIVDEMIFNTKPTEEWKLFEKWFEELDAR